MRENQRNSTEIITRHHFFFFSVKLKNDFIRNNMNKCPSAIGCHIADDYNSCLKSKRCAGAKPPPSVMSDLINETLIFCKAHRTFSFFRFCFSIRPLITIICNDSQGGPFVPFSGKITFLMNSFPFLVPAAKKKKSNSFLELDTFYNIFTGLDTGFRVIISHRKRRGLVIP